jgi:hypothetical protein
VRSVDLGFTALATLIPITVLFTVGALLVFRRFSDQPAIRRTKSLVQAHLLEFRLYGDEPRLVFRAQWDLLLQNVRLMWLLFPPVLILTIPGILIFGLLDGAYGRRPLRIGEPAVVTVRSEGETDLRGFEGMIVETAPVHASLEGQLSWRIRPARAVQGLLKVQTRQASISKAVSSEPATFLVSERRAGSLIDFFLHPTELPFSQGTVRWIEIRYPPATIFGFHWLVWFLLISILAGFALRRPLRTTF